MSDVKRLVYSIIKFLSDQLRSGNLSPDAAESLEVAIQCLEQAYSINHEEIASYSSSEVAQSLLDIFTAATQNQQQFPASREISAEAKGEAERLKNKGNELMKIEKFTEALDSYCKAIKLDSSNAIYYCNRAAAYSKVNNHEAAIADCEKAILIDPNYSKAFGRKGLAHASLGQHREAKECYEKATQLDPDNESYLSNLKVAEEKLRETNLGSQASGTSQPNPGLFGMESGGLNFSYLLNNPTLMNMATQMMADPNMQQIASQENSRLGSLLSGNMQQNASGNNPPGMQALFQAGQQLAAQMEASNPELVNQLRRQMQTDGNRNENDEGNASK